MTEEARSSGRGAIIAVAIAALFVTAVWIFGGREIPLGRSSVGFDGLARHLSASGVEARVFRGGARLDAEEIGLRVLPIHDANLRRRRVTPETEAEALGAETQRDLLAYVLHGKIRAAPTLVILPKWRGVMRREDAAHPDFRITRTAAAAAAREAERAQSEIVRPDAGFTPIDIDGREAMIYAPQYLRHHRCTPLIKGSGGDLLVECRLQGARFWILSDPDLLSNHGLGLGENAAIAAALLPELAGGGPILIDGSTAVLTRETSRPPPERTWSDIARLFDPPFRGLWFGLAALAALVIWRGQIRFGAPLRLFADGPGAAREVSLAATARLLRLSGHDGALVAALAEQRLRAAAADLLGPRAPAAADPLDALTRRAARRGDGPAGAARALKAAVAATRALPHNAPAAEAVSRLDDFEYALERMKDDAGRAARAG